MNRFIIGIDFGMKYIGLAIGERITNSARPLVTLLAKDGVPNWFLLDELMIKWDPCSLVVGVSFVSLKIIEKNIIYSCRKFKKRLQQRYNLPVYEINEDFTTWEVKKYYKNVNKNLYKLNAFSAVIILENWLRIY